MMSEEPKLSPAKRPRIADVEGVEIPFAKRNILCAYRFMLHFHCQIAKAVGVIVHNIDSMADITSVMFALHTSRRQESYRVWDVNRKIEWTGNCNIKGTAHTITMSDANVLFGSLAAMYGFIYQNNKVARQKTGTLSAILSLCCLFKHRLSELRIGNASFTYKNRAGVTEKLQVERIGLTSENAPHLTGCTYNPTVASAMKQSLGPLTIAINLALTSDPKSSRRWERAFLQTFKLIPGAEVLVNGIKGRSVFASHILCRLGSLCRFGVACNSHKGVLPMSITLAVADLHVPFAQWRNGDMNAPITEELLGPDIKNIDSSGHGLWNVWNKANGVTFYLRGDPTVFRSEIASEVLFHSMLGFHKYDLGLIEFMTGRKFLTRKEMRDCLKGRRSRDEVVPVQVIPATRICKLANAAHTPIYRGQIHRVPTANGSWTLRAQVDYPPLIRMLNNPRHRSFSFGSDPVGQSMAILDSILESIQSDSERDQFIDRGTQEMYLYDPLTNGAAYGKSIEIPHYQSGRNFYSQS